MDEKKRIIIFTDLDGTLLDHGTYSYGEAETALNLIRGKNIPLILCSSKFKEEIKVYRRKLSNNDPFISENGGAIFIPEDYKGLKLEYDKIDDGYLVIEIGSEFRILLEAFEKLRKNTGVNIKNITEFTVEEIVRFTGLSREEATLARKREYTLPFIVDGSAEEVEDVKNEIMSLGLNFTEGARFLYLMGGNDKGKAVDIMVDIFRRNYPESEIFPVGIGDSLNDQPMLEAVNKAFLVKNRFGDYEERIRIEGLVYADGIGPVGWNRAVLSLFNSNRS